MTVKELVYKYLENIQCIYVTCLKLMFSIPLFTNVKFSVYMLKMR